MFRLFRATVFFTAGAAVGTLVTVWVVRKLQNSSLEVSEPPTEKFAGEFDTSSPFFGQRAQGESEPSRPVISDTDNQRAEELMNEVDSLIAELRAKKA